MPVYYVLVRFEAVADVANPEQYVADAVATMKGSYHPASDERGIDEESIQSLNVSDVPYHTELGGLLGKIRGS